MASFGEYLQRERKLRRITLEEIAQATKIGTRLLRALEEEDFDKLPGGIFNRGFVRSYARFLGLDEEQAIAEYEDALREKLAAKGQADLSVPPLQEGAEQLKGEGVHRSRRTGLLVVMLAAVGFVIAYVTWLRRPAPANPVESQGAVAEEPRAGLPAPVTQGAQGLTAESAAAAIPPSSNSGAAVVSADAHGAQSREQQQQSANSAPAGAQAASTTDSAAAPMQDSGQPTQTNGQEFEVRVQATQDCWVLITADGQRAVAETLPASAERTVRARKEMILKVGNAAGVNVVFNGKTLPPLGDVNKTATLTFTPEGVQR